MKRILVLGDSISLDYGKDLFNYLRPDLKLLNREGVEEAYKDLDKPIGGNAGDSRKMLALVTEKTAKPNFDVLLFNCGLHDVKLNAPDRTPQVPVSEYEQNLIKCVELIKNASVLPIFINTTPSYRERYHDSAPFWRDNKYVLQYNEVAEKVMAKYGVKVIDLYDFTLNLGLSGNDLFRDHTHFHPIVSKLQAAYIAGALDALLD